MDELLQGHSPFLPKRKERKLLERVFWHTAHTTSMHFCWLFDSFLRSKYSL